MFAIERVLQSQREWLFAGSVGVTFVHAPLPWGGFGVPLSRVSTNLKEFLRSKGCIIEMARDKDRLCCARAIVVARAIVDKHRNARFISQYTRTQVKHARVLMAKASIPLNTTCGPEQWPLLQKALGSGYSLVIVSREMSNSIVYYGNPKARSSVCLYLAEEHYHVITKLPTFFGRGFVCPYCYKASHSQLLHVCDLTCLYCKKGGRCVRSEDENGRDSGVLCDDCNVYYVTRECYQGHKDRDVCRNRTRCEQCGSWIVRGTKVHRCGYKYCSLCKSTEPLDHKCYIQPLVRRDEETATREYIFYDFECMTVQGGVHEPNLCVVHRVCTACIHLPMDDEGVTCDCGRERVVFRGRSTLKDFGAYVLNGRRNGAICMAHNSSGYDVHFLLTYALGEGVKPNMILNGRKIMSLDVQGVKFIDSLNFFPMSLAKLPRAFGLNELCKGYFPHLFNVPENQDYRGAIPEARFYAPDQMGIEGREVFLRWYETQRDVIFDMRVELLKYCVSDVDILQRCCGVFRNLFVEHTGLEPFTKSLTIASACNRVYRTHYLGTEEIGLIPPSGWFKGRQSSIGLCWLIHHGRQEGISIRHYGNVGEQRVSGRLVDGVDETGKHLFFFHGCYWHSCRKCYPDGEGVHPTKGITHRENYSSTLAFMARLRREEYRVTEMWECAFRSSMTAPMKTLLVECHKYEPLKPRDAFYGGRCNAIRLYAEAREGEAIKYVDFTSLYPYVNKYCRYPIKHPTIYVGDEIPDVVEGLLKCKVLPPRDLYHPVLPYRTRNKLLFPLCRTCAEENAKGPCQHDDPEQRTLTGVWATIELEKAQSLGYRVLEKFEAWHYAETSQYCPETKSGGIWAEFINKWVQLKQQASGFPEHADTHEARTRYIREYEEHEGIRLEMDKIEKNDGLRSLAKLMVNSHWGKMGQVSNKGQMTYITDSTEYVRIMTDPTVEVHDVRYVTDSMVAVQWVRDKDFDEGLPYTNVVLAAVTTACARLKLYGLLESLQERVLYFDTDSVVYVHKDGAYNPPLSDFLGGLKDEVEGDDIVEFVSLGPKNYAYKTKKGDTVCKVRGFTLNYQTSKLINFQTLTSMAQGGVSGRERSVHTDEPYGIHRKNDGTIYTGPKTKAYSMVYDKRFIAPDGYTTMPFGWCKKD